MLVGIEQTALETIELIKEVIWKFNPSLNNQSNIRVLINDALEVIGINHCYN
jgi:hypothetical protein